MSLITRRSFVKRSGLTLGGVIGLGLVPSLTRRLYATDTSNGLSGIKIECATPTITASYGIWGGIFTLTMQLSVLRTSDQSVLAIGACHPGQVTVRIMHAAAFNITVDGVAFNGTATYLSYITWVCTNGTPMMISRVNNSPRLEVTAPVDSIPPGSPRWGAIELSVDPSPTDKADRIKGAVMKGNHETNSGEWSPDTPYTPWLSYTPVCCTT